MKESRRTRRTRANIQDLRRKTLETVRWAGPISLSALVADHGPQLGVTNSVSDRHLVRKQLAILEESGQIALKRVGRVLVAHACPQAQAANQQAGSTLKEPVRAPQAPAHPTPTRLELRAILAYAETRRVVRQYAPITDSDAGSDGGADGGLSCRQ